MSNPSVFRASRRTALAALVLAGSAGAALAASVPTGFVDAQVASGLTSPTSMSVLPDGRVLVVQQDGVIRMIKNDALLATAFHSVPNVDSSNERGCLGVVPDPAFASNKFVYLYCTIKVGADARNRVLRVTEAGDRVVAGSEQVVFELPNVPSATKWHMGGAMRFGSDGKLYVAVGNHEDNQVSPPSASNSQKVSSAFGKILRINIDGTVPSDNPFFSTAGAYKAVWALGLRNPFVLDIQPGTGLVVTGDVGQGTWEEINRVTAGANFGWPAAEGNTTLAGYTNPLYAYQHLSGYCAISGTQFYNPSTNQFPTSYIGKLFFADFCKGDIRYLDPANPSVVSTLASGIANPTNIGLSPTGSLYYLDRNQQTGVPVPGAAKVGKISFTGTMVPNIAQQPQSQTVFVGTAATFSVLADGATGYQWQRNGSNIAGATGSSYTLATTAVTDTGAQFRVIVSNSFGSVPSNAATLTVTTNRPPLPRIDTPLATAGYSPGDVIAYSGSATDPEDGTLAPGSLSWTVELKHDTHAHQFVTARTGSSGSFTVPSDDADLANVWLRVTLTARDASGATTTVFRDLYPRTHVSQFATLGTPANGWGPYEVHRSNGEQGASDGLPIRLASIPYPRGLGVHAPSDISFNLGGSCSGHFVADMGVDSEVSTNGSVVFQIYLDGVLAQDSGLVRGGEARKSAFLSVANKNTLRLVVSNGGDGQGFDHASWGGAHITGCGTIPRVALSNLTVADNANIAGWSVQGNLQLGNAVYGDRAYTVTGLPPMLVGANWIRTANSSKGFAGNPLVTFTLAAAADIHVAVDNRAPLPSWLDATWTDIGESLTTSENGTARTFRLLRKRLGAGSVSLGPLGNGAVSMYTVVVK
jgi:glucose/arabinose dehydrogenase